MVGNNFISIFNNGGSTQTKNCTFHNIAEI